MAWTYERNATLGIVEVVYTGDLTAQDLQESTSELIRLEGDEGLNRFLIDTTEMTLAPSFSLVDLYDLPTKQYLKEEADRRGRVAVLLPSSSKAREAVQFYETVCRNHGWMVKVFSERQEANDWLTATTPTDKSGAAT